jgi:hypothetical protein
MKQIACVDSGKSLIASQPLAQEITPRIMSTIPAKINRKLKKLRRNIAFISSISDFQYIQ